MASRPIAVPVARALNQMAAHPAVRSLRVMATEPVATVELLIDAGLPSRWKAEGASPNGVRAEEPVTVRFGAGFPAAAPRFYLRSDFDRSHPHIQPRSAIGLPEPCISAVSPDELLRARGIHGLLDQLALWLERAARVELIAPTQGWEPTRRDHIDDIVVVDTGWLPTLPKRDAETRIFEAIFSTFQKEAGTAYGIVALTRTTPLRPTFVHDLAAQPRRTICLTAWSGKLPSGQPFVAAKYEPETVTDIASLQARAHRLGCGPQIASSLQMLQSRLGADRFRIPIPVAIIMMARRPCPVIGQNSIWELLPYIIEVSGGDDLGPASTKPVRLAMHRDAISPALLRRASGDTGPETPKPWTLLGCGSVGSHIALTLARAGRAPAHVVDKAWMAPHNFARHALLPISPHEGMVLLPKSFLLSEAIAALGQSARAHDVNLLTARQQLPRSAVSPRDVALLVNATGSLAVRDALAADGADTRTRAAETCLFANGRVAYLGLEGPECNPSIADLAANVYRLFSEHAPVAHLVADEGPVELSIGQGCASLTMPMSDARLSAMAAPMAERIAAWHANGLPATSGQILIGALDDDGMSVRWQQHEVQPWTVLRSRTRDITVRVAPDAGRKISEAVTARPGVETGGVLIGRWSDVTSTFHVVDVLMAPADSIFSRDLFVLGTNGLTEAITDIVSRSRGALYPLGTWHNHLVDSGPSHIDRRAAQMLAREQHIPVLLLIHTPGGYRFLTAESLRLPASTDTPPTSPNEGLCP